MGNKNLRLSIAAAILLLSVIFSFAVPRSIEYEGTRFIADLVMPNSFDGWRGDDMSELFRDNLQDARYKFISESLAYKYIDEESNGLLFMIINARDFHYPNVCFSGAGFRVENMKKTKLGASGRDIDAYTIFTESSKGQKAIVMYWIVVDKVHISSWVEQKIKQFYFSFFNKKSIGVLVRLDIPVHGDNIDAGLALGKRFVNDLSGVLIDEEADYIFGQKE